MSIFKKTKNMTERVVSEDSVAFTIPAEGFEKMVVYCTEGRAKEILWIHRDYRVNKKSKKRA